MKRLIIFLIIIILIFPSVGLGANSLLTNPITVDTAGATSAITRTLKIQLITWVHNSSNAIAANNDLVITDTAGNVIITFRQAVAETPAQWIFPAGLKAEGLTVSTLDGGEVYIYLK